LKPARARMPYSTSWIGTPVSYPSWASGPRPVRSSPARLSAQPTMAIRPTNSSLAAVKPISTGMPLAFLDWMPGSVMLKRWAGASLTSEALPDLVAFLVAGDTRRLLVPPFAGLVEVDPARRSRRPPRTAVTLRDIVEVGGKRLSAFR